MPGTKPSSQIKRCPLINLERSLIAANVTTEKESGAGGFHLVARQASIRFYGLTFDKLLGYAFALLVTKTYGPDAFGLYVFGVSLLEILMLLTKLGFDRSVIREVASLNAKRNFVEIKGVVRAALALTMPTGLALAAIVLLFDGPLANALDAPRLAGFLSATALAVPLSVAADIFLWATEGIGLQKYFAAIRMIIEPVIKLSLVIIFFETLDVGGGARSLGVAYAISIFASAILGYLAYRKAVARKAKGRPEGSYSRELLRVGLPFYGQSIMARLLGQADTFLIFTFVSATATAFYAVSFRTAMMIAMIAFAFEAAFRPAVAHLLAAGLDAELKSLFLSVSRAVLMLCFPACVVIILFPYQVMAAVGDQFASAGNVARLVALGALTSFVLGPAGSALMMAGRTRITFVNGLIAGLVGLALNIILIPRIGVVGAGVAQFALWTVSHALNALAARKILGVFAIGRGHASLFLAAVVAGAVGLLVESVGPSGKYAPLMAIGSATFAAYAATLLLTGIANEDKQLIRSILMMKQKQKVIDG